MRVFLSQHVDRGVPRLANWMSTQPLIETRTAIPAVRRRLRWAAALAASAMLVGLTVLAGWFYDIAALKSVMPGLFAVKANAAVCMLFTGASLWLLISPRSNRTFIRVGRAAAALAAVAGLATLSQDLLGWDLGIDQLCFREPAGALFTQHLGRMSVLASASFTLLGIALLLLGAQRAFSVIQGLALFVALVALLVIGGYLFGARSFPSFGFVTPMGVLAALGFLMLGAGILAATAGGGFLARLRTQWAVIGFGCTEIPSG